MTVYFAPKRENALTGVLSLVGQYLLGGMAERDKLAREYKYNDRLATSADERKAVAADKVSAERKGYLDQANNGLRQNPNQPEGAADYLTGFVGGGANMKDMQPFLLPQQENINAGDRVISRPLWPNGQGGAETSYKVNLSPEQRGNLAIKQQVANTQDYGVRQSAAQGWGRLNNESRPDYDFMGGYKDENGNPIMIDKRTGKVLSLPGVTPRADVGAGGVVDPIKKAHDLAEIIKILGPGGGGDSLLGPAGSNYYWQGDGKGKTNPSKSSQTTDGILAMISKLIGVPGDGDNGGVVMPTDTLVEPDGVTPKRPVGASIPNGITQDEINYYKLKTGRSDAEIISFLKKQKGIK